jgi:hypothetical protein
LLYNLDDLSGSSPMKLADYERWLRTLPLERAWRLLNVKYVVSWRQYLEAPAEQVAEASGADGKPVYLYRLQNTGSRAWLVAEVIPEPDAERTLQRLSGEDFDPERQVLLPELPPGFAESRAGDDALSGGGPAQCDGQIAYRERLPEKIVLDVTTEQPCVLVLGELYYPGWHANLDGQAVPILRANGLLRAIAVMPGSHQVSLVYRPASLRWGALVALATLLVALVLLVVSGVLEKRRRTALSPPQAQENHG